ncbi:hypothetical protein SRHO_G00149100 [Serrasalmus rhombeus]
MELSVVQTGLAPRELSCAGMLPEDKPSDQVTDVILLWPCSLLYSTIPLPLHQFKHAEMSTKPCGHQADRLKSSFSSVSGTSSLRETRKYPVT